MQNDEFINILPKSIFIIWWSRALKYHIKDFRDPVDYDIMIWYWDFDYIEFLAKKRWWIIEDSKYAKYSIYIIKFPDGSNVDVIIKDDWLSYWERYWKITDQKNYYLKKEEVIQYKWDLIMTNKDALANSIVKENKHLLDIIYLMTWEDFTKIF